MPLIARKGDSITHGGTVTGSASKSYAEGKLIARKGDSVSCSLHGGQVIVSNVATKTNCEGAKVAFHGSVVSCGAKVISGATKTIVE